MVEHNRFDWFPYRPAAADAPAAKAAIVQEYVINTAFKNEAFWVFNDTKNPCKCCSVAAIEGDKWICSTGQEWLVVEDGFCSWADAVYDDEQKMLAAETLEQKFARLNKIAAEEAMANLSCMSFQMKTHAELMAIKARIGVKKNEASRKIQRPCKWLYCDEAAPKSQWRKNADGKLCAPATAEIKSQCWAYEYLDPKTKQVKKPHTCPFLHPGEEGWCGQWSKNKLFDPQASAVQNRFAALKAGGGRA